MAAAMLVVLPGERLSGDRRDRDAQDFDLTPVVALFSAPPWTGHQPSARPLRRDPRAGRLSSGCRCIPYSLKKGCRALERMHSCSPPRDATCLLVPRPVLLVCADWPSAVEMEIR